jgi:DNA-binding transcriptional regulator YhcF (GntR family)
MSKSLPAPVRLTLPRPSRDGRAAPGDQLAAQLRYRILTGDLRPGDRLPPVRRLAAFLRVNRNTVARVYRRLEAEGYLVTRGRRGTFVRRASPLSPEVNALLERLLREAARRRISPADLQTLVAMRARPRPARLRVGFVECNTVDLTYFRRLLEREVGTPIRPVLLHRLPAAARGCDLLVTTFFHIEAVQRKVPSREVLGLVALPDFHTLEEVARLPRSVRVALVCATEEGVRSKTRSLRAVGLRRPRLLTATLGDRARLRAALEWAEVLLASPKVLERVRGKVPAGVRVIPFASVLSDGAVALLRRRLAEASA